MVKYLHILLFTLFSVAAIGQKTTSRLLFIENKGQWNKNVKFQSDIGAGAIFLLNTGFTIRQYNTEDLKAFSDHPDGHKPGGASGPKGGGSSGKDKTARKISGNPATSGSSTTEKERILRSHAYTMELTGANPNPVIIEEKQEAGTSNYFIGNDKSKWAGGCRSFGTVTYKDIYPNIDMRYFSDEGWIKYEFIVRPGGDPNKIVMSYRGADKLSTRQGELQIKTTVGTVQELPPYTYQISGKGRTEITNRYQVKGNTVQFAIGEYDRNSTLVIDPTIIFASFTGSKSDNWGYTATYGGDGSLYSGGIVFGPNYPTTDGAFQENYSGAGEGIFNMGITKFNPFGNSVDYATYIGGENSDQPHSMIVNNRGNLIIAGRTSSNNYPTTAEFSGAAGNKFGGWDIVLTELNASGTALIGSMRIGGVGDDGFNTSNSHSGGATGLLNFYGDDARSEVMLDPAGNIYLASCTQSTDFYTTGNAPYKALKGRQDAVLIKTDPNLSNVLMSTYFGGGALDAAYVVGISPLTGEIYLGGATESDDFAGDHSGTVGTGFQGGGTDGFIAVFSPDGSVLRKTTFIGTNSKDAVLGFEFDRLGDPYVMGVTYGVMPLINATYGLPGSKQFVGKLERDLSGWQYRTCFGTAGTQPNISPVAFLVDRCQNVYVSGWGGTNLASFQMQGTLNMETSADASKKATDGNDFYFIVIKRDATELLYATFFGQTGDLSEHVDGGTSRYDQQGTIYQAMCANCTNGQGTRPRFPTTPGAYCCSGGVSAAQTGAGCNLAAVKIYFNFAGVGAGAAAYINGVRDTAGCAPLTVEFRDTIRNAKSYIWNFGDGTPDFATTDTRVEHTYPAVGDYRVKLIAIDSSSCNVSDSAFINVRVRTDPAVIDFEGSKIPPCESLTFEFRNLSTAPPGKPFTDTSFIWDFGDGTRIAAGTAPIVHSFLSAGSYQIRLILTDTVYCNVNDSVMKEYYLSPLVKANFEIPNGCAPYTAQINNTSIAGLSWLWDFGDGTTSTEKTPVKIYENPGTYTVRLTVTDPNTCNVNDAISKTVLVQSKPTAGFSYTPLVPVQNTPHIFSNSSSADAVNFIWEFGDTETLTTASRLSVEHQYNSSGQYDVCLQAINISGCIDTLCQPVEAIVVPQIDLPNAFTPNGTAPNNMVFVKGFGIARMKFMIFNRVGQKIFESNSLKVGWDGKYNGVVQPMDVYAYVLDVEYTDGTRATKKGDITLIR